jgi:hypothetical protein
VVFGIERRAAARKRLFRKGADTQELADRLLRLTKRMVKGAVAGSGWKKDRFVIDLKLHPAAAPGKLVIEADGGLLLRAQTAAVGPGYHADVIARVSPILEELDYEWTDEPDDDIEADMLDWLAEQLAAGPLRLGVPLERAFKIDAPVLTLMGPRDAAWRDAAIADPAKGADVFPWRHTGPGHAERSRALVAMWLDVPWREPFDDDERELMERVDEQLAAARQANPELDLPYPEWAALLENLGSKRADKMRERAGDRDATMGYRRFDMDVELSGGWTVCLPGAFVGTWDDDRERFFATDGERVVEFTSFTANGEDDSERLLAVAPEAHPVIGRVSDDARRGRAEAYDDNGVRIVHGLMSIAPHIAILTIRGGDEAWALATWRSLTNG